MDKFYTNFFLHGSTLYVRSIENGIQKKNKYKIQPSLFVECEEDSEYKSIYGKNLSEIVFGTCKDAKSFIKEYKDSSFKVYGYPKFQYTAINELFPAPIEGLSFDSSKIKVCYIDIETRVENEDGLYGFPNVDTVDFEINLITLYMNDKQCITYGTKPFGGTEELIYPYEYCKDEEEMLRKFIAKFREYDFEILTDWNGVSFDLPYLYNRIEKVLGKDTFKQVSPWERVDTREVCDKYGKTVMEVDIKGISHIDYMLLYKKFKAGNKESYKLDFIASEELKETKLEFEGSFREFYEDNWDKFVLYNQIDVRLLKKMDDKLKLMFLMQTVSYIAKTNYEDTFFNTRVWDVLIANYLQNNRQYCLTNFDNTGAEGYEGAYVQDTKAGFYEWGVSFDCLLYTSDAADE